jgi:hypothetical protein
MWLWAHCVFVGMCFSISLSCSHGGMIQTHAIYGNILQIGPKCVFTIALRAIHVFKHIGAAFIIVYVDKCQSLHARAVLPRVQSGVHRRHVTTVSRTSFYSTASFYLSMRNSIFHVHNSNIHTTTSSSLGACIQNHLVHCISGLHRLLSHAQVNLVLLAYLYGSGSLLVSSPYFRAQRANSCRHYPMRLHSYEQ